jgi:hypothetical protein
MRITQIIQGATALIAGLLITFSQKHDADVAMLGLLIMSAGWVVASAVAVIKKQSMILHSIVAIGAMAMIAYSQSFVANEATTRAWILLMSWGFFGAILEIIFALRAAKKSDERRDYLINAALALLLVVAQIAITKASDSVSHVGFFGAYAILLAVHLGVAAASPRTAKA